MLKLLDQLEKFALDLIFPLNCFSCAQEGVLLCEQCQKKLPIQSLQVCPVCEKAVTMGGKLCSSCRQTNCSFDQLVVASDYQDPLLAKLIHLYKYRFIQGLSRPLGELMITALKKNSVSIPDIIVPLPLHPHRLRWRGFNQSELLAECLSQNITPGIDIPVFRDAVVRSRNTSPQMKLKKAEERQKNIANAFAVNPVYENPLRNKKIMLIDDICTTGSTLCECAKELQKLHPHSITAVVLARQS